MIRRKFEWWFKHLDESIVNPRALPRGNPRNLSEIATKSPLLGGSDGFLTLAF